VSGSQASCPCRERLFPERLGLADGPVSCRSAYLFADLSSSDQAVARLAELSL
jgi:hypothetical protein